MGMLIHRVTALGLRAKTCTTDQQIIASYIGRARVAVAHAAARHRQRRSRPVLAPEVRATTYADWDLAKETLATRGWVTVGEVDDGSELTFVELHLGTGRTREVEWKTGRLFESDALGEMPPLTPPGQGSTLRQDFGLARRDGR